MRPAGIKPGTRVDWPFAANIGPGLPLAPGTRYEWRIVIDDAGRRLAGSVTTERALRGCFRPRPRPIIGPGGDLNARALPTTRPWRRT